MSSDGGFLSAGAAAGPILASLEAGEQVAVVLVVSDSADEAVGRRMLVEEDGAHGSLGHAELDRSALSLGEAALAGTPGASGTVRSLITSSGRTLEVYVERHQPDPELVIVGAGHIAQPLCSVGALLGFRVSVLDDRPDFATRERFPEASRVMPVDFSDPLRDVRLRPWTHLVLVTRGHKYDYECLLTVLRSDPQPAYIGMIGSRRRVRATFTQLLNEGIPRERIANVRAPLGLDLGAETPEEIAVSVAAEIVLLRRGGSGQPLKEAEQVLKRFFSETTSDGNRE